MAGDHASEGLQMVSGIGGAGKTLSGEKQEPNEIRQVLLMRLTACRGSQGGYFDQRRISAFVDSSPNRGKRKFEHCV